MDIVELREYCLSKKGVEEAFPFDSVTLVFKVGGKMFALTGLDKPEKLSVNIKCEPELALELREKYLCVIPGFHMNKRLWNTVFIDGSVDDIIIKNWIDHSYNEVVKTLPKKTQLLLNM